MYLIKNILEFKKYFYILIKTTLSKTFVSFSILILNVVVVKISDEKVLGLFMSGITLLIGLSVITRAGIPNALIRFTSITYNNNNYNEFIKIIKFSFLLVFISSFLVLSVIIIFFNDLFLLLYSNYERTSSTVFLFIILSLPFVSSLFLFRSIIKGFYRPALSALFEYELSYYFIIIIILYLNFSGYLIYAKTLSISFLLFIILHFILSSTYIYFLIKKKFTNNINNNKNSPFENFKKTLFDFFQIDFINFILNWGGLLILSLLSNEFVVGQFSTIYWLAISLLIIPVILNTVTSPYYAAEFDKRNIKKIYSFMNRIILLLSILIIPFIFLISNFSKYLLLIIYNESIGELYIYFNILLFSVLFAVILGNCGAILSMCGYQKENKNIAIIYGLLLIILLIIFVPIYQFKAAVIVYSLSIIFKSLLVYIRTRIILKKILYNEVAN